MVIKPHAIVYGRGYKSLTDPGYLMGYRILTVLRLLFLFLLLLFAHVSRSLIAMVCGPSKSPLFISKMGPRVFTEAAVAHPARQGLTSIATDAPQ